MKGDANAAIKFAFDVHYGEFILFCQ